jgi:cytochrome P450
MGRVTNANKRAVRLAPEFAPRHSTSRDPRRWENPDQFDITRRAAGHLPFGQGVHGCVGKPGARIEGEAVLGALARKVVRIELDGEPERLPHNTVRGFESLPFAFHAP